MVARLATILAGHTIIIAGSHDSIAGGGSRGWGSRGWGSSAEGGAAGVFI